jgi:hypothetical protein
VVGGQDSLRRIRRRSAWFFKTRRNYRVFGDLMPAQPRAAEQKSRSYESGYGRLHFDPAKNLQALAHLRKIEVAGKTAAAIGRIP